MMARPRSHSILSVVALISVLLLLSSKPHEAGRVLHEDEEIWMRKKHLFLPSLWTPVTSPTPNPGTNSNSPLGEKNFAATRHKKQLLLPSLWRPVTPPKRNPGINSNSPLGEKNFAAGLRQMRKKHVLLPSLQWRPVTPPSNNPGHNLDISSTVSEKNFAGEKMPPPPLSTAIPYISARKAAS